MNKPTVFFFGICHIFENTSIANICKGIKYYSFFLSLLYCQSNIAIVLLIQYPGPKTENG